VLKLQERVGVVAALQVGERDLAHRTGEPVHHMRGCGRQAGRDCRALRRRG
jgi:hypothetical protein